MHNELSKRLILSRSLKSRMFCYNLTGHWLNYCIVTQSIRTYRKVTLYFLSCISPEFHVILDISHELFRLLLACERSVQATHSTFENMYHINQQKMFSSWVKRSKFTAAIIAEGTQTCISVRYVPKQTQKIMKEHVHWHVL